jgi:2-polyprenyl-3-methyl-5-hydroxy-6-metoxy-1,4-benzoquinol methylase
MNLQGRGGESAGWDEVAGNYHDAVISPFARGVRFRLRSDIRRILRTWRADGTIGRRVLVDFGCGCGPGLLLVAGQVGFVAGIDFSERMLDESERTLRGAGISVSRYGRRKGVGALAHKIALLAQNRLEDHQTVLVNADLRRLAPLYHRVDLGLAINSISPPNPRDVGVMFRQVTNCIKPSGRLIFLFPSLDTMYHLFKLVRRHNVKLADLGKIEAEHGVYIDPTGDRQKFFTPDEIQGLFKARGWVIDKMEKVRYPWDLARRLGWGYFPRHHRLWDWYVMGHPDRR